MDQILELVQQHEKYRSESLNLVASENAVSDAVKRALGSDLSGRYLASPRFYAGTKYADQIVELTEKRACQLYGARFASVNPIGGHIALMATLYTLAKKGDLVMSPPPKFGGYGGFEEEHSLAEMLGLKVTHLPFDESVYNIDVNRSSEAIRKLKPHVVVLGASIFLFPHPVRELADAVHSYGGKLVYDGSHVMGLIAGKRFQSPLNEGADVLLGSTHKSLFGPQGGMVLSNDEEFHKKLSRNYLHVTQDNPHPNRIAALGIALAESLKYGSEYAAKVISNSKGIARGLHENGMPVVGEAAGFTESHQVFLSFQGWKKGQEFRDKLEAAGILADAGVRVGTSEITRRGYGDKDIHDIVEAIVEASRGHVSEASVIVSRLVKAHQSLVFC
ncbi:MAG: aminotransferase class I/II-fold pyridoxal phosphate-dependent enzyme [Thermoprotei archaeon]